MAYRFFCALFISLSVGCMATAAFADTPFVDTPFVDTPFADILETAGSIDNGGIENIESKSTTRDAINIADPSALKSSIPEDGDADTAHSASAIKSRAEQTSTSPTSQILTSSDSSTPAAPASRLAERLPASPQGVTPRSQLTTVMAGLMAIIVLILALAWLFKRFGQGGFLQNQHMRVVATLPLGTREKAILVEVGEQQLLLGVTPTSINTLHVLNEAVIPERDKRSLTSASSAEKTSDFGRKLMDILQQKPSEEQPSKASRSQNHHSKN